MVYSAELLVVMTDRLKIVRIHARNVPRVHGHKRLDDDAFLSHSMKATVSRAQPANVWQWLLSKKVAATVCLLHFDTKSEESDCNKSSFT